MIENTETEKAVFKLLEERWKLGRERYGEGINYDQGKNILHWLNNAIEECADQLQYLVAMKILIEKGE